MGTRYPCCLPGKASDQLAKPLFLHGVGRPALQKRSHGRGVQAAALPVPTPVILPSHELSQLLAPAGYPLLADLPNPLAGFHYQPPQLFSVLSFLLANPAVTLGLAVVAYITVPRLWRAFLRFVVLPAALLGTAYVVVKNPSTFSNVGSFLTHFVGDHPYATSAVILIGITLVLSPYLLTALLVLFVATGIPRLPAPVRNFLPGPIQEIEQQFTSFDASVRGPINSIKEQALRLGSGATSSASQLAENTPAKGAVDSFSEQALKVGSDLRASGFKLFESAAGKFSELQGGKEAPAVSTYEAEKAARR